MTPEDIWAECLGQLSQEMSKNVFKTYLEETHAHFDGHNLVVLVANPYQRDWCAARLTHTVDRMVQALTSNSAAAVTFQVQSQAPEASAEEPEGEPAGALPEHEAGDEGEEPAALELTGVVHSLASLLVKPDQIVAVPKYLLRFVPLIGADRFWMVVAFRQVRYLKTYGNRNQPFTARADEIYKWCGMSRATFWRHLEDPELGWLIEKLPNMGCRIDPQGGAKQAANRYRIAVDIPLTPMDADALSAYLLGAGIREDPVRALETAAAVDLEKILAFPPPWPTDLHKALAPQALTVESVVRQCLPAQAEPGLQPRLSALIDQLSNKILRPAECFQLSWYFLQAWLPLLGSGPALLVTVLRSLGYYSPVTGETRDQIWVKGGYAELAQTIGLTREKTILSWLPAYRPTGPQHPGQAASTRSEQARSSQVQGLLSRFLTRIDGKLNASGGYAWKFQVLISADPLTPADAILLDCTQHCLEKCQKAGVLADLMQWLRKDRVQKLFNGEGSQAVLEALAQHPNSIFETLARSANSRNETLANAPIPALRLAPAENSRIETLDGIFHSIFETLAQAEIPYLRLLKLLSGLITFQPFLENPTTSESSENKPDNMGVGWNLEHLLDRNRVSLKRRQIILKSETSAGPFVSWLIYAASGRGASINDPVGYAISKLTENPEQGAGLEFDRLAALGASAFRDLIRKELNFQGPGPADWRNFAASTTLARIEALAKTLGIYDHPAGSPG